MNQQRLLRSLASWIQLDAYSGVGPATVEVRTPSWKGRQQRETMIPFVKAGTEKTIIVKAIQEGIDVISIIPTAVKFPAEGGERTITVSTNAETLNVVLSSATEQFPKGEIVSMKIMDAVIDVNGTGLEYGVPGDPGADGVYQVVFTIKMPENTSKEIVREKFVINNETVNMTQEATNIPYIEVDKEFVSVGPGSSKEEINIISNVDKYFIRVKNCQNGGVPNTIKVTPKDVSLEPSGDPKTINIETSRADMEWNINLKQ